MRALGSDVESIAYGGMAKAEEFPKKTRCRSVFLDLVEQRLRVAVDRRDRDGRPVAPQTRSWLWDQLGALGGV